MTTQPDSSPGKSKRGLASADPETRLHVARMGGAAISRNREHMSAIGRKGGETVSRDRQHMSRIGRKGAEAAANQERAATPQSVDGADLPA